MQNINDLLGQYKSQKKQGQQSSNKNVQGVFDEKMKEIDIKQKEKETEQRAKQFGLHYINLFGFPIAPEVLRVIPQKRAEKVQAVCFFKNDEGTRIGIMDPNQEGIDVLKEEIQEKTERPVEFYLISQHSFDSVLKLYATLPVFKKIETDVKISEEDLKRFQDEIENYKTLEEKIKKVNITDVITLIIAASLKSNSSDIHIEAEEHDIKVRFRIDGVLTDVASIAKDMWPKVIARVKLLSGLKINITEKPQDGRFTIVMSNSKIDVRVSCLPTTYGESVVMRLLGTSAVSLTFEDLGIRGAAFAKLKEQVERPQGMIITTGPTGSGKTTSLYAILNKLNDAETKIITLEDPVEYKLEGINQSQIDRNKGYTFADGLRSILRQDPDIIMVGELRDLETAEVAINASMTGHLVVSTLHTNSAAGAVPRFLAMGVQPFLLAPSLNAIIGQRLVRRVCKDCQQDAQLKPEQLEHVKKELSKLSPESGESVDLQNLSFVKGGGCDICNGTGYKGRIGIYEILLMNKEIEDLILSEKVSEYDMQDIGIKHGMVTMVQDGLLKALDGVTTVDEVFRVIE